MQTDTRQTDPAPVPRAAYSVAEFCAAHGFTRVLFYRILANGQGPKIFKAGTRTLISVEAATEWRRQMESGAKLMPPRRKS
jgi:hypothetical protein